MARTALPKRKTYAVFIRTLRGGVYYQKRAQYNVVTLDWADGRGAKSYIELFGNRKQPLASTEEEELYDGIKFSDEVPPFSGINIGL